jgi:hypothetical protein
MPAAKYTSKGASLLLNIGSPGVFTAIAQVIEIKPPSAKVQVENVPDLASGVGIPKQPTGWVDAGQAGGSCYFDPADATQKAITGFLAVPAISHWKITYPDIAPTSWTYDAIVTEFTPTVRYGEHMKADFMMDVSGLVTGW